MRTVLRKLKFNNKRLGILGLALIFGVVGSLLLARSFAACSPEPCAEVYLSPSTASIEAGSQVTFDVRVDPSQEIDGAEAVVDFDPDLFELISVDDTTSDFPSVKVTETTSNSVRIEGISDIINGVFVSTDSSLAQVTLRALSTAAGNTTVNIAGGAYASGQSLAITNTGATVTINTPTQTGAAFTIESSNATPVADESFNLNVYVDGSTPIQAGEIKVNIPADVSLAGSVNVNDSDFVVNQVDKDGNGVACTGSEVCLVFFVEGSTGLSGKQLIASIPVSSATTGSKNVSVNVIDVVDTNGQTVSNVTSDPLIITVSVALDKPTLTLADGTALESVANITDARQGFIVGNYDSAATYAVTIGSQSITVAGSGAFAIPYSLQNGDYKISVTVTKSGSTQTTTQDIRLRHVNVNRTGCVNLQDLMAVNNAYGSSSKAYDLNFDGTVSLIDLLTVVQNYGELCAS